MLRAKVETTWDDGSPKTARDERGGLWRVAVDIGDGTLAVEKINEGHDNPQDAETCGMTPCAVATWTGDEDGVEIEAVSHGENGTDATRYDEYQAGSNGWTCE